MLRKTLIPVLWCLVTICCLSFSHDIFLNRELTANDSSKNSDTLVSIQALAKEAYQYSFPMIVGYKVLLDFNVNKGGPQFKAPFNVLASEARVFTSKDTATAAPNSDTPYSFAQLDLRGQPMIIFLPEIEKSRYYDVQLADMYTNNYGYLGSRTSGSNAGYYMIAGPDWKGDIPKGIKKLFRCETEFSLAIFRTQLFGPEDMTNVRHIQSQYRVQTLSNYLKKPSPSSVETVQWLAFSPEAFSTRFIPYVNFILQFCPATGTASVEAPLREKFAKIGIGPGLTWDASKFSPEEKAAIGEGVKQAIAEIFQQAETIGKKINGWQIGAAQGDRNFYNNNWLLRAAAAKNGIYGNSAEEAVYPFAKSDMNDRELDGSKHNYSITFPTGQLPPVNAFWSVTLYNQNQFLVDNPIGRYLINSAMLAGMKKNDDRSITIFVQHKTPGTERESNWLPSPEGPFSLVMRLYWPKTETPSALPVGQGTWTPPSIVSISNLNSTDVKRSGDKSYENIIRTDDRYGHDPFFTGPRGWGYWNYLEYPKPIQNPNLWPDQQSTYFLTRLKMPAGSSLILKGPFPRARYMKYALYRWEQTTFVSLGEDLSGAQLQPDRGSINPFKVGSNRFAPQRDYTITIKASDAPEDESKREQNTLYAGNNGGVLQLVTRLYLPDQPLDGTGWGPASTPSAIRGLPSYEGQLADGTKLNSEEVVRNFVIPIEGATKQPLTGQQWFDIVHAASNNPSLDPATSPALPEAKWEKYWNLKYSILGAFKTPEERANIPYAGAMDAGGDPSTQYLICWLSRKYGKVYVMRGKMPTFPDTYNGETGEGLKTEPDAETQYWSLVSCEAAPSGKIVDGVTDMQVPLDANRNYTIVCSRKEDKPSNAIPENGIAWIEWSPSGEGIDLPGNRVDFGMLMLRIMANNLTWKERPDNVLKPGTEAAIMGPYLPTGEYMSKKDFEALKFKSSTR